MIAKKYKLPIQNFVGQKPLFTKHSDFFVFKIFKPELDHSRFGLVISGSIIKKAVQRNKIKRTIFDWLRINGVKLPTYDYLFILKNTTRANDPDKIVVDLSKVFI